MKSKVYIVCEPTQKVGGERVPLVDLTPAAEWGEPVVLLQTQQSFISPITTVDTLTEKLASFGDTDYLVPIGDPVLMCIASMVAAKANNGRVKMLKWDKRLSKYFPILVDINRKA